MDPHRLAVRVASNPTFSGRAGDNWTRWLAHFELRFRDIQEAERVGLLIDLLEGSALDYATKMTSKVLQDYKSVTKELGSKFGEDVSSLQAYAELGQVEQEPGEETEDFGNRVLGLVKQAYPGATSQQIQDHGLKQFICGLADKRLQEKLVAMDGLGSLDEALRVAKTYKKTAGALDAVRARKEGGVAMAAQRQPGRGAVGHPSEEVEGKDAMAQMKEQLNQIQKALAELEARTGRSEARSQSPKTRRRCFQCGETSHLKWQCPQLREQIREGRRDATAGSPSRQAEHEPFCVGCGRKGHWLARCWRVKTRHETDSDVDRTHATRNNQEN